MALEPITRQEKIIAGQDLTPITRMEKFLKNFGGSGGGGAQPDLSQTDTTKPDYVKGVIRQESLPEGYPYVGEPAATEVVPATTLEFDGGGGINAPFDFAPTAGLTYLVNWNGVEWECVAQAYETIEFTGVVLGDGSLAGLTGNGEPFVILYIPVIESTQISQASGNVTETITISITEVAPIIHTINEKFLPNNIFTVIFKYYNGSVECHASYEQIENALIGGKEIKAKMVFSSNDNPDAPMLFVGLDSYTGGGYQFICFNVAGSERQLIIYTCLSDGSGWKEERLSLEKAAYVANAAGETVTAAEFNALLTSLKSAGILATS